LVIHLPQKGARVGAYEIIEQLGQGGCGYVYKAERGGRYYAVKVLNTLDLDGWTRREVTALVNLPLPNVVRFIGYDRWPDAEIGYPCIIMEFVSGLPLDAYALRYNPSTRRALTIFLKIAQALREVFRLGVLHRDIKESNIVIRAHDGEPILVDFGFSSVAGIPTVTGPGKLPPGTPEYRSPEAMQFLASMTGEDSYTYSLSDELWALGVTLYWLLTDVPPFGTRNEPGLQARIRLESPPNPRTVNPRVPEAVSRLCLRMLEKDPRARFQTHDEICSAVEKLLSANEGDASWDVPLIDPNSPHRVSTVGGPNAEKPRDEHEKQVLQWIGDKPRRGCWREGEPPAPPDLDKLPPPVGALEGQAPAPSDAPSVKLGPHGKADDAAAAQLPPEVPAGPVAGGAAPPVRELAEARAVAEPKRRGASSVRRWLMGTGEPFPMGPLLLDALKRPSLALVAVLALVALAVGSVGAWRSPAPTREAPPAPLVGKPAPPPVGSAKGGETEGAAPVREVAQTGNPAEANKGAAPVRAQPPAPTPTAMFRKPDTTKKPDNTPKHQPQRAEGRPPLKTAAAVGFACALLDGGCTGGTAQVRPTPAPIACPSDWQEAHQTLGIGYGMNKSVVLQGYEGENTERAPVQEGPVTVVLDENMGKLPGGTLLSGTLQLGEGRFYGTFTQAHIPGGGSHPVCLVIGANAPSGFPDGSTCPEGLGFCPAPESRPGNVKMFTRFDVFHKGSDF
jgi:serine/threonine-protein kinase